MLECVQLDTAALLVKLRDQVKENDLNDLLQAQLLEELAHLLVRLHLSERRVIEALKGRVSARHPAFLDPPCLLFHLLLLSLISHHQFVNFL